MKILCLGFGFCANGLWHDWQMKNKLADKVFFASHRDDDKKKLLQDKNITPLLMGSDALGQAMVDADMWLVSASPNELDGDPFIAAIEKTMEKTIEKMMETATEKMMAGVIKKIAPQKHIIYLSTTGVYGDHGGDWVDEESPCNASHERSKRRLVAEQQWRGMGAVVLRLGGIYGPLLNGMGQNTLQAIQNGKARRIEKAGQVFGRIHVFDIAAAIEILMTKNIRDDVFNLVDDEPANPRVVVDYGYELLQQPLPPLEDFAIAAATMSPMAQSFFQDNKRVKNDKIKKIGWQPNYPNYRAGLEMIKKTMEIK